MQIFLWDGLRKSLYLQLSQTLSDFYLCFIDDIFLIWNGTKTNKETDISSKANQEQKDSLFITHKILRKMPS